MKRPSVETYDACLYMHFDLISFNLHEDIWMNILLVHSMYPFTYGTVQCVIIRRKLICIIEGHSDYQSSNRKASEKF